MSMLCVLYVVSMIVCTYLLSLLLLCFFFFKQKTAYEMRISDWSSDVCSADAGGEANGVIAVAGADVGDGHARANVGGVHDVVGLVDAVTGFLGRPFGRDERGARPVGGGKFARGFGPTAGVAPGCVTAPEQGQRPPGGHRPPPPQSM